jgi:N utilization substance protein B
LASQRRSSRGRQKARELLVKALYQWQITGHARSELAEQFKTDPEYGKIDQDYFRELLAKVLEDAPALDELIAKHAVRGVEQLDAVGRAVLLLGLAELKWRPDVPVKVVINEAIELTKRYGAADSFKFVNAVLDKTAKEMGPRTAALGFKPLE